MPNFTVRSSVLDRLVMNDGHAQETLHTLLDVMATEGGIFRQGEGDNQRGVVIRALTETEIKIMNKALTVSIPSGLLLPALLTPADVQDFAEQRFAVVKLRKLPHGKFGAQPADFRADLAHRLIKSRLPALRPLRGVTYAPIMRGDGTVVGTPGYDAAMHLWVVDGVPQIDIAPVPARADAEAALKCLRALLAEHPFETEDDLVAALAMLMVPALRASMTHAPLLVADAAYARTGKDYLLGTAALIGTGFRPSVFTLNEAREEQQKRLGSALLLGAPVVSLNNINGRLASDELAAYLTEGGCVTRAYATVGGTKFAPNGNVIAASGNNIVLGGDLPERAVTCRQDAGMEYPGERAFNGSPHDSIRNDRGKYLAAVFTIARWAVRGTDYQVPAMSGSGGFDGFDRLIRGPLLTLTHIDPRTRSREEMQATRQHQPDRALIDALAMLFDAGAAFGVKHIQAELRGRHIEPDEPDPWAILRRADLPYRLRRARGRRGAAMQLASAEKPVGGDNVAWYCLVALPQASGTSGGLGAPPIDDLKNNPSILGTPLRNSPNSPNPPDGGVGDPPPDSVSEALI